MELTFHTDPAAFLADAEEYLAADPVVSTVVSSLARRALAGTSVEGPESSVAAWWLVVREDGAGGSGGASGSAQGPVVGAGMRTMGFPTYLLPMPDSAARALGSMLLARDEPPSYPVGSGRQDADCTATAGLLATAEQWHRLGHPSHTGSIPSPRRVLRASPDL